MNYRLSDSEAINNPEEINSYCLDILNDRKTLLKILFVWGGFGYVDKDGNVVTDEQVALQRRKMFEGNPLLERKAVAIYDELSNGASQRGENMYGLFSSTYKKMEKPVRKGSLYNFVIKSLLDFDFDSEKPKGSLLKIESHLRESQKLLRSKVKSSEDVFEDLYHILYGNKEEVRKSLSELRPILPKVARPKDKKYCQALSYVLSSELSSWTEIVRLRRKELASLNKEYSAILERYGDKVRDFLFCCRLLSKRDFGLTMRTLTKVRTCLSKKINSVAYRIPVDLFRQHFASVATIDNETMSNLYRSWEIERTLEKKLPYIRKPGYDKNVPIPFGLSGRGYAFTFIDCDNHLGIQVEMKDKYGVVKKEVVKCHWSHYFANLRYEKVHAEKEGKDGKIKQGKMIGYCLKFNHRVKHRRDYFLRLRRKMEKLKTPTRIAYSEKDYDHQTTYTGLLKEVQLFFKKDRLYVRLPYVPDSPDQNYVSLAKFWSTAKPDMKKYQDLPDSVVVSEIDLNMYPAVCAEQVSLRRNKDGEYQIAHAVSTTVLGDKGTLSRQMDQIRNKMTNLKNLIRRYKECRKEIKDTKVREKLPKPVYQSLCKQYMLIDGKIRQWGMECSQKDFDWLKKQVYGDGINPIGAIQFCVAELNKSKKISASKLISSDLAASCSYLALQDEWLSLVRACANLRTAWGKPSVFLNTGFKEVTPRRNFRKDLSRQIASCCVKASIGSKVTFFEDLSMQFSKEQDSSKNLLVKLFAPRQLREAIEQAFYRAGLVAVFVDPAGTSTRDPLTDQPGWRDNYKKQNLWVEREGKLICLDADREVAPRNILLKGLDHSVKPYKINVNSRGQSWIADKEAGGKRLRTFFERTFGTTKIFFIKEEDGSVHGVTKVDGRDIVKDEFVYCCGDCMYTERKYREMISRIKHLVEEKRLSSPKTAGA